MKRFDLEPEKDQPWFMTRVEYPDGELADGEEAAAEIAKRDEEIEALMQENARLEGLLRALVEDIGNADAYRAAKAVLDGRDAQVPA